MHCDLGFAEVTEELSYLSDHPCSATFRFPLPSRAAVFKCAMLSFNHSPPPLLSSPLNLCLTQLSAQSAAIYSRLFRMNGTDWHTDCLAESTLLFLPPSSFLVTSHVCKWTEIEILWYVLKRISAIEGFVVGYSICH